MSSWPEDWMTWRIIAAFLLKPEEDDDVMTSNNNKIRKPTSSSLHSTTWPLQGHNSTSPPSRVADDTSDKIQWNSFWRITAYLAYWVVLTLSVLESLEVVSVSAESVGASQVARAVSMSPALLGFTEIIRTLQIVFRGCKNFGNYKSGRPQFSFYLFYFFTHVNLAKSLTPLLWLLNHNLCLASVSQNLFRKLVSASFKLSPFHKSCPYFWIYFR